MFSDGMILHGHGEPLNGVAKKCRRVFCLFVCLFFFLLFYFFAHYDGATLNPACISMVAQKSRYWETPTFLEAPLKRGVEHRFFSLFFMVVISGNDIQ